MTVYRDCEQFLTAIQVLLATSLTDSDSNKKDARFEIGDPHQGFYLMANEHGWKYAFNGVDLKGTSRLAAPLSNLQASQVNLG